jgi:hypothetical protein
MPYTQRLKQGLFALLATLVLNSPLAHSALIGLQPGSTLASTGDSISLDLVISGLGNFGPDSLGAFDISIGFDPSALSFTDYVFGDFLGDFDLFEALDVSSGALGGTLNIAEVSLLSAIDLDALQPSGFTLARLNFTVTNLAAGAVTQVSVLSGAVLADANGDSLSATSGGPVIVEGRAATVPVPGTAFLLIASFFGWLALKRRRFSW